MNKKLLAIVLGAAVLIGGVALGVHLLHKDALAATPFLIFIQDQWGNGVEELFLDVQLFTATGVHLGNVGMWEDGPPGWYKAVINHFNFPNATWWGGWITGDGQPGRTVTPTDPSDNPTGPIEEINWQGENQFTWEVEVELPPPR